MAAGLALLWLALINGVTWLAFAADKRAAIEGDRRTPERTLLMLALIGGTPAAFHARASLRHKTRKQPFSSWLYVIAGLQLVGALAMATPGLRQAVLTGLTALLSS